MSDQQDQNEAADGQSVLTDGLGTMHAKSTYIFFIYFN